MQLLLWLYTHSCNAVNAKIITAAFKWSIVVFISLKTFCGILCCLCIQPQYNLKVAQFVPWDTLKTPSLRVTSLLCVFQNWFKSVLFPQSCYKKDFFKPLPHSVGNSSTPRLLFCSKIENLLLQKLLPNLVQLSHPCVKNKFALWELIAKCHFLLFLFCFQVCCLMKRRWGTVALAGILLVTRGLGGLLSWLWNLRNVRKLFLVEPLGGRINERIIVTEWNEEMLKGAFSLLSLFTVLVLTVPSFVFHNLDYWSMSAKAEPRAKHTVMGLVLLFCLATGKNFASVCTMYIFIEQLSRTSCSEGQKEDVQTCTLFSLPK